MARAGNRTDARRHADGSNLRRDVGADYGASRELRLSWPQMNHEVWLYLQMLTNLRATVYEIDKEQRGLGPRFAAVRSDDAARLEDLAARGFRKLGTVTDPVLSSGASDRMI